MNFIKILNDNDLLKVINEPLSIDLEIAHLSYLEVKKQDSKALLFLKPTDKNGNILPPLITNVFGSFKALNLALGKDSNEIAKEISSFLNPQKPENFKEKLDFFTKLLGLKNVIPKRLKEKGICQKISLPIDLEKLPILKTWEKDGGNFITMGQVYTVSLDGKHQNLGMYRLQVYDKTHLGMHWQIHKDAAHFFHEYKKAGKIMPISVGIGGDPLYIWCSQAPLPKNIFELLLYGFIRKSPAKLVKSITNDIYIPHDLDYVIEGVVNPNDFKLEGPFGDHTGYYTPIESFPVMEVTKITCKKNAVFQATVVGKPPLEDKFMGYGTERIFLPLLKTTTPDLIDYKMPENGVFHNLILAKFNYSYPGHAKQLMHAFWGVGQMSFVKHAIFVPQNAPDLGDYENLSKFILNRFSPKSLLISEGLCDQLDHASPNSCYGGKLGIDVSEDLSEDLEFYPRDEEILSNLQNLDENIKEVFTYFKNTKNPITLIRFQKNKNAKEIFDKIKGENYLRIVILLDENVNLKNPYMLVWRITNSIDALRDIYIDSKLVFIDATAKNLEIDDYKRSWPDATNCSRAVIDKLISLNLIENDEEFFKKFEIFE